MPLIHIRDRPVTHKPRRVISPIASRRRDLSAAPDRSSEGARRITATPLAFLYAGA